MASLTLKNLPDALLRRLRDAADRDRRSLNQEVQYLLEAAIDAEAKPSRRSGADVERQVKAWRRLAGRWQSDEDEAAEVRRIVRGRTRGRPVDL